MKIHDFSDHQLLSAVQWCSRSPAKLHLALMSIATIFPARVCCNYVLAPSQAFLPRFCSQLGCSSCGILVQSSSNFLIYSCQVFCGL